LVENRTYRLDNTTASINTPGNPGVGQYGYSYDFNKNRSAETVTGSMQNWGYTTPGNGGFDAKDRLTNWQRSNGIDSQQWNLSLVDDWSSTTINGTQELRGHNDAHELLTRNRTSTRAGATTPKPNSTTSGGACTTPNSADSSATCRPARPSRSPPAGRSPGTRLQRGARRL